MMSSVVDIFLKALGNEEEFFDLIKGVSFFGVCGVFSPLFGVFTPSLIQLCFRVPTFNKFQSKGTFQKILRFKCNPQLLVVSQDQLYSIVTNAVK